MIGGDARLHVIGGCEANRLRKQGKFLMLTSTTPTGVRTR
jgi:hypothetical protein